MNKKLKLYLALCLIVTLSLILSFFIKSKSSPNLFIPNNNQYNLFQKFDSLYSYKTDTICFLLFNYKCEACKYKIETLQANDDITFIAEEDSLKSLEYLSRFSHLKKSTFKFYFDKNSNFRNTFNIYQTPTALNYLRLKSMYFIM